MKKTTRIVALAGAILLVLMYVATLVFAFIDHSATMGFFKASIACTIVIPVLLYGIILFTRLTDKKSESEDTDEDKD